MTETRFLKTVNKSVKSWYTPLIVGLIFIVTGLYTFTQPETAYLALALIFAVSFLISGIAEIYFALTNRNEIDNWGWTLSFGIISTILGLLLLTNPGFSMITLPLYIGFTILFRSIGGISYSIGLRNYGIKDWINFLLLSILGIILAIVMIVNPALGGIKIVIWTGLTLIASGVFCVYLSLRLKNLKNSNSIN